MRSRRNGRLIASLDLIEVDGGAVLFDRQSGKYLQTNEVGLDLMRGLLAGFSVDYLREQIMEKYQVPRDVVLRDTTAFLDELAKAGLIK